MPKRASTQLQILLEKAFITNGKKAQCRACSQWAIIPHSTRQRQHLLECEPYMRHCSQANRIILMADDSGSHSMSTIFRVENNLILFPQQQVDMLVEEMAYAVYMDNLPFRAFEGRIRRVFRRMHAATRFPSRKDLAGRLLVQQYNHTRHRVMKVFEQEC